MKFDAREAKIFAVPPVNKGEFGGMAVLDANNKLVAYNKHKSNDLKNWSWVRYDFVGKRA